jgi:general secretion pathway protein B
VAATSGITISGIAYQDDRSMRRAVINGALVGEGAEVAGAKVVEIRENRVRFSRAGENFEILQSSAFTQH